ELPVLFGGKWMRREHGPEQGCVVDQRLLVVSLRLVRGAILLSPLSSGYNPLQRPDHVIAFEPGRGLLRQCSVQPAHGVPAMPRAECRGAPERCVLVWAFAEPMQLLQ